jgi:hypothetical protein
MHPFWIGAVCVVVALVVGFAADRWERWVKSTPPDVHQRRPY